MSYIHMIVKGDQNAADKAAKDHGLIEAFVVKERYVPASGGRVETVMRTQPSDWGRVANWFSEAENSPYPDGTLLFFSFREEPCLAETTT